MANKNNTNRVHTSPGVYFKETELTYSSKSLGITTLGVAGETLRGPAFEPITIENWRQYLTYFGGTSTEKFKGNQYPKYELPYIAKSYLKQSQQLEVVRVLGLSGVNAGPAWVITAHIKCDGTSCDSDEYKNMVVAVIRSRGEHEKARMLGYDDVCEIPKYEYDGIKYFAQSIRLRPSQSLVLNPGCNSKYEISNEGTGKEFFPIDSTNYGNFTIEVLTYNVIDNTATNKWDKYEIKRYSISLNPNDKNYIYKVIGGDPQNGDTEIFIEELYDVALSQLVNDGYIDGINENCNEYLPVYIMPSYKPVEDIISYDAVSIYKKNLGKKFIYDENQSIDANGDKIQVKYYQTESKEWSALMNGTSGWIYTLMSERNVETNIREYFYGAYCKKINITNGVTNIVDSDDEKYKSEHINNLVYGTDTDNNNILNNVIQIKSYGLYYIMDHYMLKPITLDFNNYREEYRYSSTPWILSEIKGSAENVELHKLFRFHTISDGDDSSIEVKISIENIYPEEGYFDVTVRDFTDTDSNINVLERFSKCNLVPGDSNYIAYKIGSFDGTYSGVSKYITVEVNEDDLTQVSIPSGFMGYPVRNYNGYSITETTQEPITKPYFKFNTTINEDIKSRRQYFGISDLTGIDTDIFKYKGTEAYNEEPDGLTSCFHLDSRILNGIPDNTGTIVNNGIEQVVTIDGITGYSWSTVDKNQTLDDYAFEPRIGNDDIMENTIYEDKANRKFTLCFYGGWDGWDYYRTSRSNTDDFSYSSYKGKIDKKSGYGVITKILSMYDSPEKYGFSSDSKILNTDYYAYLSAIRQFANPKMIDINIIATPGIDYVNNTALVNEVLDMVTEERADALYVITTPDKPSGASDSEFDMYTPDDIIYNLEESEIDTNRACTYYPWEKYYDEDNYQYIYLPVTLDVVRNLAYTDNIAFPWFAAAGWNRGDVTGVRPKKKLKLSEQDTLYDGRINFINSFAMEGDKIWGDKNLQVNETMMNRISKRRLLLRIKKLCENACIGLLFDPNDNQQSTTFTKAVSNILDSIKSNRGIIDYRIEVDNSLEAREKLTLPAKIFIKPTKLLEYIDIECVITPEGVQWN